MNKKILFLFYFIITLIFLIGILLSSYNFSYLGYYSDKIIRWIWLRFNTVIILKFWEKKLIKIYSITLITIVFSSILPMTIPFFGIINYFSTIGDYQQIQIDSKYRIERTKYHPLSMQRIYVYEKKGFFEKNICRPDYGQIVEKTLNIDVYKTSVDLNKISIQNSKLVWIDKDSIGIEYQILGKKKSLYHKLNDDYGH